MTYSVCVTSVIKNWQQGISVASEKNISSGICIFSKIHVGLPKFNIWHWPADNIVYKYKIEKPQPLTIKKTTKE